MRKKIRLAVVIFAVLLAVPFRNAPCQESAGWWTVRLASDEAILTITVQDGKLARERFTLVPEGGKSAAVLETDGDFLLNVMWTGWRAPGKTDNADNPVEFDAGDFRVDSVAVDTSAASQKRLTLFLRGENNPFEIALGYLLRPGEDFYRRILEIRSVRSPLHFLRIIRPLDARILNPVAQVLKEGGFGQPGAVVLESGGAFFGLEYPAAHNWVAAPVNGGLKLRCQEEVGQKIGRDWRQSHAVVVGLSRDRAVKRAFFRYLDHIRVAPLRPYLLYNTWYDLRAPEMVNDSLRILNEANIRRIISLFRKNMVRPFGVKLDAFVLDDGWDVYRSDWRLRPNEFPHGLAPIARELAKDGTKLGIWFGPIGGYSHRDWRLQWMREHGYETVGTQLCVGGKNYHLLLKKRVTEMVRDSGVRYFKWDGIQFSCSEAEHGHPIGLYSRRAIMDSVIDLCRAVRNLAPDMFLNITSGTWLSPWWLLYANQIWMQGYDYGYANVPSLSRRDAAITYRDYVLYDDLKKQRAWFPVANLMTHGIIKGHLQKLGGEAEPLDKFTDNALLYFARGVSMWELYVSPDLLSAGEWRAIVQSIRWAKDRFPILRQTEMIGGNPGERKPYGYFHAAGDRAVLAVRNPFILPETLKVKLDPAFGLSEGASSLVLERVYPTRWISPELYSAGGTLEIPLQGYETAVYELYPLKSARWPLVAGAVFSESMTASGAAEIQLLRATDRISLLNPELAGAMTLDGKPAKPADLARLRGRPVVLPVSGKLAIGNEKLPAELRGKLYVPPVARNVQLAVLLETLSGDTLPAVDFQVDGEELAPQVERQRQRWTWQMIELAPGRHQIRIRIEKSSGWQGKVSVWGIGLVKGGGKTLRVQPASRKFVRRVLPPRPFESGNLKIRCQLLPETEMGAEGH